MDSFTTEIDLSLLPEEAKKQLFEFYRYLVAKYGKRAEIGEKRFQNLIKNPIIVEKIIISKRADLHE